MLFQTLQLTQTKQNPFQNTQVRGLDWASGDSSECDSFKSKTSHSASLFNTTILKTNTKIKNSIKYTYKKVQYNIRVTCFVIFQALPRFVYSFGQRHPKCVPVTIKVPGLGMLTDSANMVKKD